MIFFALTPIFHQIRFKSQLSILHSYKIPKYSKKSASNLIQGFRAPYLQTAGDTTFYGLQSLKMNFDSSLPTVNYMNPPIWPFTMDYGVTHVRHLYFIFHAPIIQVSCWIYAC